jgi:hypothetical protein
MKHEPQYTVDNQAVGLSARHAVKAFPDDGVLFMNFDLDRNIDGAARAKPA